jgi:flagellar biosynthesis/type III secretory pathway protein FliH
MGIPLSRVLHDFSAPAPAPAPAPRERTEASAPAAESRQPVETVLTAQLDEAFARGEAAGRAAAQAEHEHTIGELRARAGEERDADRRRWAKEEAQRLAESMNEALAALEARISDAVARALTPLLARGLRERMIDALAESVDTVRSSGRHAHLHISGPEDLLAALRERIGSVAVAAEWEPNGQPEVRIVSDDTLIETDIQSWADRFAGAVR